MDHNNYNKKKQFSNRHQFDTEIEFNIITSTLPIMVRACNQTGLVIYSNEASKQLCEDAQDWFTRIHDEYKPEYKRKLAANSQLKTGFNINYKFKTGDDDYFFAEQAFPWYSLTGSFLGFVCYTIAMDELADTIPSQTSNSALQSPEQPQRADVYAEKLSITGPQSTQLNEHFSQAQRNLEQILNMLPASVVIIRGYDLIVEMINNSNLTYWNKTKKQVLGKPFLEILPDLAEQPFAGQLRRVMSTGEIIDIKESPVLFTNPDGSTRETYVDYTYQPLLDAQGNRTGVLVMSFEITDRVMSKRAMEKYAADLAQANASLVAINEELALSEARFKYLIQEAPVAIGILHGRELVIESANQMILDVWGKTVEIVGLPLSKALPELEGQPFLDILDRVYTTSEPFYANEIRSVLEHQGELKEIFFNVTYKPILNFSGRTSDILVVAVDVTEQVNARRKVEQSEKHFKYLADLVPAKIFNARPEGEITFLNKQWLDFTGLELEDLQGFGYFNMMHPDEIRDFQNGIAQSIANRVPFESEMRFKDAQGKYIWHLNVVSPILDEGGNIYMWVGSTTDISSLKAEEKRKSNFISMLSHELKTPITSIKGHVQLLLRVLNNESSSSLTSRLKPSLSRIDQLLSQLNGLIGDMLDLTRIEQDKLEIRKRIVLIDSLVEEVVQDFRLSHQQHRFHLNSERGIKINIDSHKITQVLINLIDNAIKYAPRNKNVDISVLTIDNEVLIKIKDYGIGINEENQERIFDRFHRVEGKDELHYGGFGIGLYLASTIVALHAGRISLESSIGNGSTFTIHLPYANP